jgi:hypothetical protein
MEIIDPEHNNVYYRRTPKHEYQCGRGKRILK